MTDTTVPAVYGAIAAVMADLASEGIAKTRKNQQQGYNFRGIDEVYNALAPVLAKHKLLMLPRVLTRAQVERTTAKGGVLFYTTVEVEFDLVSGDDGSSHTIRTVGEAMDSADKSSNKAMSAAYKYAAMQAFCIPTEGDNDADATTHEVVPRKQPETARPQSLAERAAGFVERLQAAADGPSLEKTWALGSKLCADLDASDPDTLASVTLAYEVRRDELTATPFDEAA